MIPLVSLLGNEQLKRFFMVMEDDVAKALNMERKGPGLSCSPAPSISLQLQAPGPDTLPLLASCPTCPVLAGGPGAASTRAPQLEL